MLRPVPLKSSHAVLEKAPSDGRALTISFLCVSLLLAISSVTILVFLTKTVAYPVPCLILLCGPLCKSNGVFNVSTAFLTNSHLFYELMKRQVQTKAGEGRRSNGRELVKVVVVAVVAVVAEKHVGILDVVSLKVAR